MKKVFLTVMGGVFLFSFLVNAVFPDVANAQGMAVFDYPNFQQNYAFRTEEKVQLSVGQAIQASVMGAAVQGIRYGMEKLAYDAAQYVANGGKGQFSQIFTKNWYKYLGQIGGDALGSAVSELGKAWGLDLCKFPKLDLELYLKLGLTQMAAPSTDCTWSDLVNAYGKDAWVKRYNNATDTASRFDSSDKVLKEFSKAIKPANTDFGIAVGAMVQVDRIKVQREKAATAERSTNKGFKDLQDLISGNVKTPGEMIGQETEKQLSQVEQGKRNEISLAGIYGSGLYQIIPETASMFLNTLGSTLLQKLFSQGIVSDTTDSSVVYDPAAQGNYQSIEQAKAAYTFLLVRPEATQIIDYPILAEYAACPSTPGLNNCVMDSGLQDALSHGSLEAPMTIREALKQGYLNPSWPLISPLRERDNTNIQGCLSEKYCYSNIQKLRKVRVLPLGFEIAALRSDPEHPWTLGEVVDGFDKCNRPDPAHPEIVVSDPAYPFCHLINPNWVLKGPVARCDSGMVISNQLVDPSISSRKTECLDVSTCIAKDSNGGCAQFGYCTKEKNVWRIPGDICPAEYSTCTTYTNAETHKITSYLARTVDYGECSIDNVGCRAYSIDGAERAQATSTVTVWRNSNSIDINKKKTGRNQVVFFNEKIQNLSTVCSESNNGCSAFWGALRLGNGTYYDLNTTTAAIEFAMDKSTDPLHIKKAPDYLGCYDVDPNTAGIQWPSTPLQAASVVKNSVSCDKFASACVAEEVGCEAFTQLNSNTHADDGFPTIPGKIGDNNYCDQSCVGYETFKQEKSPFDIEKFPLYFIPSEAQSCPAIAAGCSEFTNIDTQSNGGEGLEYYTDLKYCEKPAANNANVKTFYSWEGSADNGFVLRTYQLKPLTSDDELFIHRPGFVTGSPAYILDTNTAINDFLAKCDETKYNTLLAHGQNDPNAADPKCKAIFDSAGHTYYRLIDKTVTVDPSCHPLRKTETLFEVDPALNRDQCTSKSGRWNEQTNRCDRCLNGGKFQNGFCIYQTISRPTESTSCQGPSDNPGKYNGCRGYSGNSVGNIEDVFSPPVDDFEPGEENAGAFAAVLSNWTNSSTLKVVTEATITGKHSLQVNAANTFARRTLAATDLTPGSWYELSFLAKSGTSTTRLVVGFKQNNAFVGNFTTANDPINVGNSWQLYTVGPIQFTGNTTDTLSLSFERTAGRDVFFLDQVRLRHMNDYSYYIKDSWKNFPGNDGRDVPLSCDSAPEDNLPGEALGCREYRDSTNVSRYATGFQNLCREKAIACQPVWDTFNTLTGEGSEQAQAFNVVCTGAPGQTCQAMLNNNELGNCFIQVGATSCSIPHIILPLGMTFDQLQAQVRNISLGVSSVFVPEDTTSTAPIFLAVGEKQKYSCEASATGCQFAGKEDRHLPDSTTSSFAFNEIFIKNDPDTYKDTLCRNDLVGCSHYLAGSKETFFKDPQVTGNSLCKYRGPSESASGQYGWYLDGVGKCTTSLNPQRVGDQLCKTDSDCGSNNGEQNHCVNQNTIACAPDNLQVGGMYDIWSNKSPNYKGNVGICGAENNACTEIIDRQDTSNLNPEGKPYYVIFNSKIEEQKKKCTQASLSDGCVLFDKTDEPNKVFDSAATYHNSAVRSDAPYGPVPPVTAGDAGFQRADTNLLMKVNRDRDCSEWLSCRNYVPVNKNGRIEFQCSQYSACEARGIGDSCAQWADDLATPEDTSRALNRLDYNSYVKRSTSWFSEDYSGYSLYNKYQINNMAYVGFSFPESLQNNPTLKSISENTYLVRKMDHDLFTSLDGDQGFQALDCETLDQGATSTDWRACGLDLGGRCYSNNCIYPISGAFKNKIQNYKAPTAAELSSVISELEMDSCKAFPEVDSPFANSVAKSDPKPALLGGTLFSRFQLTGQSDSTKNVNICQQGNCSCEYQKVTYESGSSDYWPISGPSGFNIPEGICVGGKAGFPCIVNTDCTIPGDDPNGTDDDQFGTCSKKQNTAQSFGQQGFCLEYDRSRPLTGAIPYQCLTWLPINISVSRTDINNTHIEAGYDITSDATPSSGQNYCVESDRAHPATDDELTYLRNALYDERDDQFRGQDLYNGLSVFPGRTDHPSRCPSNEMPIHVVFCGGGDATASRYDQGHWEGDNVYQFMDVWSRKNISSMAKVLRVEVPNRFSRNADNNAADFTHWGRFVNLFDNNGELLPDEKDYYDNEGKCGITAEGSPACNVHTFAPAWEGADDYGPLIHPPAFLPSDIPYEDENGNGIHDIGEQSFLDSCFDDEGNLREDCDGHYKEFFYPETDTANNRRILSTVDLLPGGPLSALLTGSNHFQDDPYFLPNKRLVDAHYEIGLTKDAITRVYFIPTGFPYGAEGENPALFTKEMYIDIPTIDSLGGHIDARSVEMASGAGDDELLYFPGKRDESGQVFTYKLNAGLSYPDRAGGIRAAYKDTDDNQIAERYVALFAGPTSVQTLGLVDRDTGPDVFSSGPGSTNCRDSENWFAVGMDFNADGKFLGYVSRWCAGTDQENNGDNGIQFAVVGVFNNQCIDVQKVYDGDANLIQGTSNKAWTNRLWQLPYHPAVPYRGHAPFVSIREQAQKPFGSLDLPSSQLITNPNNVDHPERNNTETFHYFFTSQRSGLPYSCGTEQDCSHFLELEYPNNVMGVIYNKTNVQASDAINELFAFSFARFKKADQGSVFSYEFTISDRNTDKAFNPVDSSAEVIRVPQIYSVNPFLCRDLSHCTAAEKDNITVGMYNGTLADYNGDGLADEDDQVVPDGHPDFIVSNKSYHADIRFFAFADDNRMPIRSVRVDWGDDIVTNDTAVGLYKNHKPLCSNSLTPVDPDNGSCVIKGTRSATGLPCNDAIACPSDQECISAVDRKNGSLGDTYKMTRFGDAIRACEPGFFQYAHEYTCGRSDVLAAKAGHPADYMQQVKDVDGNTARLKGFGLADNDWVCVYKPKVQVADNWGWCNGSCIKTYDPNTGAPVVGGNQSEGCYGTDQSGSGVPTNQGPRTDSQCDDRPQRGINPWSTYDGAIVIIPPT